MIDPADRKRLQRLGERIRRAKAARASKPHVDTHHSMAHLAWRMVIELVAGPGIGCGIGYGLDLVLGTMPLFLVLFTILGLAAGVRVMLRTAQEADATGRADLSAGKGG